MGSGITGPPLDVSLYNLVLSEELEHNNKPVGFQMEIFSFNNFCLIVVRANESVIVEIIIETTFNVSFRFVF